LKFQKFRSDPPDQQGQVRSRMETLLGKDALDKINGTWILIVGAGVGGTYVAYDLARKGYNLKICDGDKVKLANLGTQKYGEKDLGENKAVVAAKHSTKRTSLSVKAIGIPYVFAEAVRKKIDLNADVVIAFTDSFLSRFEVSEYFYQERPVISAGLGESGTWGWNFVQEPGEACLRCCFCNVSAFMSVKPDFDKHHFPSAFSLDDLLN
jgi:molybdopterin/thiamine biosynthesis adenylyltransferase